MAHELSKRFCVGHGHGACRFPVSWTRVIPEGIGPVNPKGLDFYDRLADALIATNGKMLQ